jgi:hypothetical protein
VPLEQPFRLAFVFGLVAHALTRDQEDVQDARATTFMNLFYDILLGQRGTGVNAGRSAPPPAQSASGMPPVPQ